jgi:hypothetical protein
LLVVTEATVDPAKLTLCAVAPSSVKTEAPVRSNPPAVSLMPPLTSTAPVPDTVPPLNVTPPVTFKPKAPNASVPDVAVRPVTVSGFVITLTVPLAGLTVRFPMLIPDVDSIVAPEPVMTHVVFPGFTKLDPESTSRFPCTVIEPAVVALTVPPLICRLVILTAADDRPEISNTVVGLAGIRALSVQFGTYPCSQLEATVHTPLVVPAHVSVAAGNVQFVLLFPAL